MRGSDCINIQLFHQVNVPCHFFKTYCCGCFTVKIVTVNTFKLNCFTVDSEHLAINFNFSEANLFDDFFTVSVKLKSI